MIISQWTCVCGRTNQKAFCGVCGKPKPVQQQTAGQFKICSKCKELNKAAARFCCVCGNLLPIPKTVSEKPVAVKEVKKEAPKKEQRKELVIENGVLTEYNGSGGAVVVPDGVAEIGEDAFSGGANLGTAVTAVVLPLGVKKIGGGAFANCDELVSVTIPETVEEIESCAFGFTTAIKSLDIPSNVKHIGQAAFEGWTSEQTIFVCKDNIALFDSDWKCVESFDAKIIYKNLS